MLDYDQLIFLAKARLLAEGKEPTALAIYKILPKIKKEFISAQNK